MFVKIKAINFYSWKELNFSFKSGVTLVSGWNEDDQTSEGSGKSSIFEALAWCLYGQSTRDVNIDDVIRTGEKSCSVEVQLEDGTTIVRSRKPNQLLIQNGDTVHVGKDARETQTFINTLIGMSFSTFCNSVYFGQNYTNKFITASQEDKAKIFSELQDLSIFDRASKKSVEKLKQGKIDISTLTSSYSYKQSMHNLVKSELYTFDKLSSSFDTDKLAKLDKLIESNNKIHQEYKEAELELQSITNLGSISDKENLIDQYQTNLNEILQKLYHINQLSSQQHLVLENNSCPACGQNITGMPKPHVEIEDDTLLKESANTLKEQISAMKEEHQILLDKNNTNNMLTMKISYLKDKMKELNKQVNEVESMNNPYIDKMIELTKSQNKLESELLKIKEEIDLKTKENQYLDFLKEGFKEIKSHVFKSLLQELNDKTNKYLMNLFDLPCSITFDNISEEGEISKIKTVVMLDNQERSLGLLSGGQFRRVQLAVDFALSDIVSQRSKNPINVRILDESFKDLSEESMIKVIDILQQMKGSTILIEHNSLVKNIVNNVFNVQLKNGVSSENR